jgi:hypothetical protein
MAGVKRMKAGALIVDAAFADSPLLVTREEIFTTLAALAA